MSAPGAAGNGPLIHPRYVFGLLLRLCVNFAGGVGILLVILYFALSRPLPGDYAEVFHALRNLSPFLRPILAVSVLAYALLACGSTSALCIFILHKVAGPLYRMEQVLDQYRSGAFTRSDPAARAGVQPLDRIAPPRPPAVAGHDDGRGTTLPPGRGDVPLQNGRGAQEGREGHGEVSLK
jgi:hypothetical protein